MVNAVSSQQENLPRKRSKELGMRYSNFNPNLNIQQLQYYHSSTYPMQTAFDMMLTISNLQWNVLKQKDKYLTSWIKF